MNILFESGFETGDFSEWDILSPSGLYKYDTRTDTVHSGNYAARLTIATDPYYTLLGVPDSGVRLGFHNEGSVDPGDPKNLPDRATYEAWFNLPNAPHFDWLNLVQWKQASLLNEQEQTRVPVASLCATTIDGQLYLQLKHFVGDDGMYREDSRILAVDTQPLPVGEWFPLTTTYEWSKEPLGRITVMSGARTLFDIANIRTELNVPYLSYPRQWTVNNYGDARRFSLYVDDCKVWTE